MSDRLLNSGAVSFCHASAWLDRVAALRCTVRTAWRRHASRRRIATLDRCALKDIGLSYADAENEANKPFWRG